MKTTTIPFRAQSTPPIVMPRRGQDRMVPAAVKKIMVPFDFSDAGKPALGFAHLLARCTGASVGLIYVLEPLYPVAEAVYIPPYSPEVRAEVRRKLEDLQKSEFSGMSLDIMIREGIPFQEIVKAARETKADMIVMTTHGYTGLKHVLLGSTAERVVRYAPCPVCVVPSKLAKKR